MLDQTIFKSGYGVSTTAKAQAEKNDCAVRAVANAFGVCYDTAHTFAQDTLGRKAKRGVLGMEAKFKALKTVKFDDASEQMSLFPQANEFKVTVLNGVQLQNRAYTHKKVKFTVKTFMQKHSVGTYMITVKGHALTIKDGVVLDNPNYRFNGYRRPVVGAIRVAKM